MASPYDIPFGRAPGEYPVLPSISGQETLVVLYNNFQYQVALGQLTSYVAQVVVPGASGGSGPTSTDTLAEGTSHLYFTSGRARAAISATGSLSYDSSTGVISYTAPAGYTLPAATSSVLGGVKANAGTTGQFVNGIAGDGSLTYGTPAAGSSGPTNTDALTEGTTNLYFTQARARGSISATGSLAYNATTGVISYTAPATVALGTATPLAPGTAAAGTSANAAHEDHVHPTDTTRQAASTTLANIAALTGAASRLLAFTGTNTVTTLTYGTSGANAILQLDATGKLPALDGSQLTNLPSGTTLGSVTPSMNGTAAVGTATTAAHADHVHPSDTSRQPADATLTALAGVTTAADQLIYATGADAFATTALTGQARTLLAATTAAAQRTAAGAAASGANSDITSLTGLTTALSVAQGGTGATTGSAALTSLGAQASSALLTAIAGVSAAANKVLAFTGATAATVLSYGSTAAANILLQLDANGRINAQQTQNLRETVNALGNVATTATIDLSLGDVVTATMTAATTFSFTNPPASGISKSFVLKLSAAGFAATWPASVHWQGGTAPTLAATGRNRLWFTTEDGGTTWDGALSGAWT